MIESENAGTNNPRLTVPWIIMSVCAGVIGFSLVFLRLPTHSGPSVLGPATLVDRYTEVMTHPITIIIEIIWLCAAFAKKLRGWWLLLFAGILGNLLGLLTRKLLAF
jgi:hypothetical protein